MPKTSRGHLAQELSSLSRNTPGDRLYWLAHVFESEERFAIDYGSLTAKLHSSTDNEDTRDCFSCQQ